MNSADHEAQNAALEEYRSLRSEILSFYGSIDKSEQTLTTLLAATIGATMIVYIPELPLLMAFLICSFWQRECFWIDRMVKNGVYISLFIEPKIKGLGWENLLNTHGALLTKNPFMRFLKEIESRYPFMYVLCMLISIIMKYHPKKVDVFPDPVYFTTYGICLIYFVIRLIGTLKYYNLREKNIKQLSKNKQDIELFINSGE